MTKSKKNNRTFTQLTPGEYNAIKAFCDMEGLSLTAISKATKRSVATIHYIRRSTDFEDYLDFSRKRIRDGKNKAIVEETPDVSTRLVEQATEEDVAQAESVNAIKVNAHEGTEATSLLRIANAMERLADDWEEKPKKGLFR